MGVPKFLGRDCELSTTGVDALGRGIDPWVVTQAVLERIGAAFEPRATWTPRSAGSGAGSPASGAGSTDELRHWPPNGQCYYSDLAHVEVCTAETLDPRRFAAQCLSTLLVVEEARVRAEAAALPGTRYCLSTAGVDLRDPGIAWGAHLNVSVSTELWEDLFEELAHPSRLGFVASAMAAATAFFGCGYLEPIGDEVVFNLSARAHHLTRLVTLATTVAYGRGLLNSRRESHADGQERLHLIGFDFALAGAALLATFVQCALLAAEEGFSARALDAPVEALRRWSRGLDPVSARVPAAVSLADGGRVTLAGYVRGLAQLFLDMHEAGLLRAEQAPRAAEHLALVRDLAHYLEEGSLGRCARHLDWAAKLVALRAACEREGLGLGSEPIRLLDHDFASSDPARGLFWRLWAGGELDPLVRPEEVEACLTDGPEDSRAWARGRLIQRFAGQIVDLDWSWIELARGGTRWPPRLRIELPQPGVPGRASAERWLARSLDLDELERRFAARDLAGRASPDPAPDVRDRTVRH